VDGRRRTLLGCRGLCWLAAVVGVVAAIGSATGIAGGVVAGRWKADSPPPVANARLNAVSAIPGTSAFWAVGWWNTKTGLWPVIERRSGRGWSTPMPLHPRGCTTAELRSVAAKSAHDAWAVRDCAQPGHPIAYHWDGASWRAVPTPADGEFDAVTVTGRGKVVAVGTTLVNSQLAAVIAKWNGTGFVSERTNGLLGRFFGVAGRSVGVWAVGTDGTGIASRVIHRGPGTGGWKVVPTPMDAQNGIGYSGVVTTGGGATVWVVGGSVVERYHAGHWTVYPILGTNALATSITRVPHLPVVLFAGNGQRGMFVWAHDQGAWHRLPLPTTSNRQRLLTGIAAANARLVETVGWKKRLCGFCDVPRMLALRGS
jgi:hypothetical protein